MAPFPPAGVEASKEPLAGHLPDMWQGLVLGAGNLRRSTAGLHFRLTRSPCRTGGDYVIQIVDGEVSRTIAATAEAVVAPTARPLRRGQLRAFNRAGGGGLTMKARRPVRTRTASGQEEIAYRTAEMDEGRLYPVEWNGEHYALRKLGGDVEIFKFRADEGGGD